MIRRKSLTALAAFAIATLPRVAFATGVTESPDNGSEQMARGGAWLARASDPLATVFNPAGLAGQASRITIQSNFLFHHTCMTRLKAASDASPDPLVNGATGHFPRVCNDIEPTFNPQFAATLRVNDRLGLGFAVIGPALLGEKNWPEFVNDGNGKPQAAPQRYLITRQSGIVLFPTIGVGWEALANLRLGVSFGWGIAKLQNSAATVALNSARDAGNDVKANLQIADFFIPRVSAGGLWSVSPNVDVAGWYQWTDSIKASGDVGTATNYYTAQNAAGNDSAVGYGDTIFSDCGTGKPRDEGKCGSGDNAKVTFNLPMEAKVGLRFHQPRYSLDQVQAGAADAQGKTFRRDPLANDRWDAEIDLTWANNSIGESLQVRFPSDPSGLGRLPVSGINSTIPPNADQPRFYKDVFGVRIGGDLNVIPDKLALRAGGFFETSGANDRYQTIDFAPSQRFGFALGGTYRIRLGKDLQRSDAIELMVGYGHTFFADQSRENPNATGIGAIAGSPCPEGASATGPGRCSDGTQQFRTRHPVNLGTITNALNVINIGAAYRF